MRIPCILLPKTKGPLWLPSLCVCVGGGGGGDGGRKFNCPGNITSNIAGMDVATIAEIFHTMAMGCLYIH